MENDLIARMKKNKRLKLTTLQAFTHYGIVLFPLPVILVLGWAIIEIYITDTYSGGRTGAEIISASLPFIALAIIFGIIQYRRLRFREFRVSYSDEQFQEAINRTVKDLRWTIEKNNKNFFRAGSYYNWTGSWGEMVTILKDENRLFINSICDPNQISSVASFGRNRNNINTFVKNLSDVLNDIPYEATEEKVENEWSVKRIFIRMISYPLCIFLIALAIYLILENFSISTIILGIGVIAITGTYLYLDIKILITRNKKIIKSKS